MNLIEIENKFNITKCPICYKYTELLINNTKYTENGVFFGSDIFINFKNFNAQYNETDRFKFFLSKDGYFEFLDEKIKIKKYYTNIDVSYVGGSSNYIFLCADSRFEEEKVSEEMSTNIKFSYSCKNHCLFEFCSYVNLMSNKFTVTVNSEFINLNKFSISAYFDSKKVYINENRAHYQLGKEFNFNAISPYSIYNGSFDDWKKKIMLLLILS